MPTDKERLQANNAQIERIIETLNNKILAVEQANIPAENIEYMKFLDGVDRLQIGNAGTQASDAEYSTAQAYCQNLAQIIMGS